MIIIARHKKMDFTFAQRLEQIMHERQLYASDLSKITGIPERTIRDYTSGIYMPNAFAIKRIAVTLNVSADYLLGIKSSAVNRRG